MRQKGSWNEAENRNTLANRSLGLLGNPLGNGLTLLTSNGVALSAPVQFRDLYGPYAESWRVPPRESLLGEETLIKFRIPQRRFIRLISRRNKPHTLEKFAKRLE